MKCFVPQKFHIDHFNIERTDIAKKKYFGVVNCSDILILCPVALLSLCFEPYKESLSNNIERIHVIFLWQKIIHLFILLVKYMSYQTTKRQIVSLIQKS